MVVAPAGGTTITIHSASNLLVIQPAVRVAAGALSASFPIVTKPVTKLTTVVITVTFGGQTLSRELNLSP